MSNPVSGKNNPVAPIPAGLAARLLYPKTPWLVSEALFERIMKQASASQNSSKGFTTCELLTSDPEYDFELYGGLWVSPQPDKRPAERTQHDRHE